MFKVYKYLCYLIWESDKKIIMAWHANMQHLYGKSLLADDLFCS